MRLTLYTLMPLCILVMLVVFASLLGYEFQQLINGSLPLDKIISKATQFLLVLSIFPLKKHLNLNWAELGFAEHRVFFKQILKGLGLSLLTLLPVLTVLFLLDVHIVDDSRHWTFGKILEKVSLGLLLALLIALFEEIIFRGLLFSSLQRKMSVIAAMLLTSFYYAALHFLKSKTQIPYAEVTPLSGFKLMAEAFGNWLNPDIISALITLFVVGLFLAVLRTLVPQSLGLCIGCHCGWVWQIKVSKDLFNVNPHSDYLYLVSAYDGVVGPLIGVWLAVALLGLGLYQMKYGKPTAASVL